MIRRVIAGFGRTLISLGVLLLLFVGYQLWGTGIAQARLQNQASKEFEQQLAALATGGDLPISNDTTIQAVPTEPPVETTLPTTPTTVKPGTPTTKPKLTTPTTPTTAKPVLTATTLPQVKAGRSKMQRPKEGKSLGKILIKRINMNQALVEGADKESLKTGPGHYATTPLPGQPGNVAIACHRTTYGAPCFNLHLVRAGDEILIQTLQGKFRYVAEKQWTVRPKGPDAQKVLANTPGENVLTLTTCEPQYSAKLRRIVRARLVGPAADEDFFEEAAPPPTTAAAVETVAPTEAELAVETTIAGNVRGPVSPAEPATTTTANELAAEETEANVVETPDTGASFQSTQLSGSGPIRTVFWLRGRQSVWIQTLLFAGVAAQIWLAAWWLARRRKLVARAVIYTVGFFCFFGPALFFCYEYVAQLLPESV
jgi:sortase A